MLEFFAGKGFTSPKIHGYSTRLGNGLVGRVAAERQTVHLLDLNTSGIVFNRKELLLPDKFTEYFAVPLVVKGELKGVLEVFNKDLKDPSAGWIDYLETLARQTAIAIDNAQLFENLQHSNLELVTAYDATIEGWSLAMDLRDKETEGHTKRVTTMTVNLARKAGISADKLIHIRRGALLHDMGKLGVSDSILLKPGKLTDEEWVIMKRHPQYAYEMLSKIKYLRPALDIPYCHHERWDGTGYPRGLVGEQIPLAARIFTVVDVWDALRSDRPYRKAWSDEEAIEYIKTHSGKDFDPQVVNLFLDEIAHDKS